MTRKPPRLDPCTRSRDGVRLVFYWKEARQLSLLVIESAGRKHEVIVHPRHANILVFLLDAWHRDERQPETLRGIRSARDISIGIANLTGSVRDPIQPETVVNYVHEFRAALRRAWPEIGCESDGLIESASGPGYRVGPIYLEVVAVRAELGE